MRISIPFPSLLLNLSIISLDFSSLILSYSACVTTFPLSGSLIVIFSDGFKIISVQTIVFVPSLISRISPGKP